MYKDIDELHAWYRREREIFVGRTYIIKGILKTKYALLKQENSQNILVDREVDFSFSVMKEIRKRLKLNTLSMYEKNQLSAAILSLKNRSEYLSEHADLHTTWVGLVAFLVSLAGPSVGNSGKVLVALFVFFSIAYLAFTRLELRREVAVCKELANCLENYLKIHDK